MVWNCCLRTHQRPTTTQDMHAPRRSEKSHKPAPAPEREGALPLPPGFDELTDEEVAAEARAFWLDDLCDRRDEQHAEGSDSFVLYE